MDDFMGLEGSQEEEDAAKLLQSKFKEFKIRRASKSDGVNGSDSGQYKNFAFFQTFGKNTIVFQTSLWCFFVISPTPTNSQN